MRPKEYTTLQERKKAQKIGFIVCIGANLALLLRYQIGSSVLSLISSLISSPPNLAFILNIMPWIVNFGLIIWGLIFNPEFTTGYLTCIALTIVLSPCLGIWLVASCVASLVILTPIYTSELADILFPILISVIFFGGIYLFYRKWGDQISHWWSKKGQASEP